MPIGARSRVDRPRLATTRRSLEIRTDGTGRPWRCSTAYKALSARVRSRPRSEPDVELHRQTAGETKGHVCAPHADAA